MAHFALQIGRVGLDIEDEDMSAKQLAKLASKVMGNMLEVMDSDDEDDEEE